MNIPWNPTFETGHPLIDSQHKELMDAINRFLTACQQEQSAEEAGAIFDFLIAHTQKHFDEEEALQQELNYPDFPNHQKLHELFIAGLTDLSTELKQAGSTTAVNDILRNVGAWFVNHILQQDTKVAEHLKHA